MCIYFNCSMSNPPSDTQLYVPFVHIIQLTKVQLITCIYAYACIHNNQNYVHI